MGEGRTSGLAGGFIEKNSGFPWNLESALSPSRRRTRKTERFPLGNEGHTNVDVRPERGVRVIGLGRVSQYIVSGWRSTWGEAGS